MTKKVLFITQSYPSVRSANVICDDMIMRELIGSKDVEVHCLCMRYNGQVCEEIVNGIHVHRFRLGRYFEFKDNALNSPGSGMNKFIRVFDRVLLRMNQVLTVPIYPCYYPFRTRKYIREAEELHRRHEFDVVACEHFGYETMMAGYSLKVEHPNVRYLQFFWDALSGGTAPGYLPKSFIDRRRMHLESKIFETADASVAMLSHRESLSKKEYAVIAEKSGRLHYKGIPYLQDVSQKAKTGRCPLEFNEDKVNVVFAGNLWGRNLQFIASVISAVNDFDVVLWVITSSDISNIEKTIEPYKDHVRFVPYLNHEDLLEVLIEADALVNMGVKNPNAISGKIFEYIGCCKPIISTYSIDNEACLSTLRRYPASFLIDERRSDIEMVAEELARFLRRSKKVTLEYGELEKIFYDCTPEAYCDLFDCAPKGK